LKKTVRPPSGIKFSFLEQFNFEMQPTASNRDYGIADIPGAKRGFEPETL